MKSERNVQTQNIREKGRNKDSNPGPPFLCTNAPALQRHSDFITVFFIPPCTIPNSIY